MILKKNIKYYLIYAVIFITAASLSAAVRFAYGFSVIKDVNELISETNGSELSFDGYILFTAEFIKPLLLVFLSAFTIYSCAVGAVTNVFIGARFGILIIRYCTSALNEFTHAAALIFFLAFASVFTFFSTQTALYRNTLRYTAPSPSELLKAKNTLPLFYSFLSVAAIVIAFTTALYFFLIYFPI